VTMFGNPSAYPTDPKNMTWTTSTSSTIMMNRCSFDGCDNRPTINGNGRCRTHGGRTKCNHLGCDSFAQKSGKCGSHRPDKISCSATGCTNLPQKNGVCKTHGGSRICEIHGCTGRLFQSRMCNFHYKNYTLSGNSSPATAHQSAYAWEFQSRIQSLTEH
jgi:hypothetical protein